MLAEDLDTGRQLAPGQGDGTQGAAAGRPRAEHAHDLPGLHGSAAAVSTFSDCVRAIFTTFFTTTGSSSTATSSPCCTFPCFHGSAAAVRTFSLSDFWMFAGFPDFFDLL